VSRFACHRTPQWPAREGPTGSVTGPAGSLRLVQFGTGAWLWRWFLLLCLAGWLSPWTGRGQIDPVDRELIEAGYNLPLEGHPPPLSGYGFYYRNLPEFLRTNLTLRLAVAPVYLDSELGVSGLLGEHTDLGLHVAGGGFADSYAEIRQGTYYPQESFWGHDAEGGVSVYHLFNPGRKIPLNGLLRGTAHYSVYERTDDTAPGFRLPGDHTTFNLRAGLRWGGREPTLFPPLAMELSLWYEGQFRSHSGAYGDAAMPGKLEPESHLFWGEAFLGYTLPELKHSFYLNLTAGTSVEADRFSAYRLGGLLPLVSEFPLPLPGYYFRELSAKEFALLSGTYLLPLDRRQRWNLQATASTAVVSYLPGLEQPGDWHNGVGGGLLYRTSSLKIMLGYAYGINAIRTHGRGADSLGLAMELDLKQARKMLSNSGNPSLWRGLPSIFTR